MSDSGVRVLVLSNRTLGTGLLFDGCIAVETHLAVAVLRCLREQGVDIQDGDALFFPYAAPAHRVAEVRGSHVSRLHGWDMKASEAPTGGAT